MMIARNALLLALLASTVTGGWAMAEPLTVFECRETLGRDWPRTLVTYRREFQRGQAKPGELCLVNAAGTAQPVQLWRVKTHDDGSLASARISFQAQLASNGSYRFELQPGKPASGGSAPTVQIEGGLTTLENRTVALRLPAAGEVKFAAPLGMGADHGQMVAAYGQQVAKGIAPGPIQGIRLADGRWVGGSYFFAANPEAAPKISGYNCRITEQGPLFVEAAIRYTFTEGGWYEFRARMLADDPAIRMDEQLDMGPPGSMWDYRVMISLASGWTAL